MTTIVPTKKPKFKTYNPITFSIPATQQKILKSVPRHSFNKFKQGNADATDWYNITFRIKVAVEIAKVCYEQITVDEIQSVLTTLLDIKDNSQWRANDEQLMAIESGLDAMDTLQDESTRRVQLDATHKAQTFMKQFL